MHTSRLMHIIYIYIYIEMKLLECPLSRFGDAKYAEHFPSPDYKNGLRLILEVVDHNMDN